jgi:hypothetical protein
MSTVTALSDRQGPGFHEAYEYRPLDESKRTIRLLKLHTTASREDPLEGELVHIDLDGEPAYNAISYMWGDPTPKDVIYINGRSINIGENLGRALRHVRHHDRATEQQQYLWVDGVCIQQSSIRERNHQVGLMRRIYKAAQMVYIWLDEELDDTNPAFSYMVQRRWEPYTPELSIRRFPLEIWKDAIRLFKNPYWKRLWIQGEVISAMKRRVYLQNTVISGDAFRFLTINRNNLKATAWTEELTKEEVDLVELFSADESLCIGDIVCGAAKMSLTTLVYEQLGLRVSEPRDHVYGLLNVVKREDTAMVQPDYGLSVMEVFLSAFAQHAHTYGDLKFLLTVRLDAGVVEDTRMVLKGHFPPNSWLQAFVCSVGKLYSVRNWAAGSTTCLDDAISRTSNVIRAQGFCVDIVSRVVHLWSPRSDQWTLARQWRSLVTFFPDLANIDESRPETLNAVLPALLRGRTGWDSDDESYLRGLCAWKLMADGEVKDRNEHAEMDFRQLAVGSDTNLRMVLRFIYHSAIISTQAGSKGIMEHCAVEAGDQIWIVFGCDRPMILRPYGDYYLIVGSPFIPGYMHGEAVGGKDVIQEFEEGDICHESIVREIKIW